MNSLLDDVRSPFHKDSPGFQNPLMKGALVFAVSVMESTVHDLYAPDVAKGKGLSGRIKNLAEFYEMPIRPDLLTWVRGMTELRNAALHTEPPSSEAEQHIAAAGLPQSPDDLGENHVDLIRRRYDEVSMVLLKISFYKGVPRDQWGRKGDLPPLPPPRPISRFRR